MALNIYDKNGELKLIVQPADSSTHQHAIQEDNVLNLSFVIPEYHLLDVNDYIDWEGSRYQIIEQYVPGQKSTVEWSYDCKLYGIESLIKRGIVLKLVDNETRPVFPLTAPARQHMTLLVDNINRIFETTDFKVGEVIATGNILIDYNSTYINDALSTLASEAGTEWWFDGMTINLTRCEHSGEIALGYKNGLITLERTTANNVKFFTRLYPLGATRNIDFSTYGYSRLQLPDGQKYVEQNVATYGIIEQSEESAFSHIYPRRVGTVSSVRSEEKTGQDGNPFTIYYIKDKDIPFDPNDYEIGQLVKQITFESGELNGRDFEVNYNSDTQEFEIITQFPEYSDQLPNDILIPKPGDQYVLWNIRMPDEYYALAEQELKEAVDAYMRDNDLDKSVYKAPTDYIDIAKRNINLIIGQRIRLESNVFFHGSGYRNSRITRITRKINNPTQMDIEISDVLSVGKITSLENSVNEVKTIVENTRAGVPDIIKSWEGTPPADTNLFSALRTNKEIDAAVINALRFVSEHFLSKVNPDAAQETIAFLKGLVVGDGVASIDAAGNTTTINLMVSALATIYNLDVASVATIFRTIVQDYISSSQFVPGFSGEGFKIQQLLSGDWNLEIDSVTVRKTMTIFELLISKIRAVNGGLVISPANGRIKSVSKASGYYILEIDGDMTFTVNDLVRCQVFASGSARYYWVEIKKIEGNSIHCLEADFNGVVPEVGDDLVQFGNTNNALRQGVLYLTASEDGRPRLQVLAGVNSTNLNGKTKAVLGCLDGIADTTFPAGYQPSGYGLYSDNAFLKGMFVLQSGKTTEQDAEDKAKAAADSIQVGTRNLAIGTSREAQGQNGNSWWVRNYEISEQPEGGQTYTLSFKDLQLPNDDESGCNIYLWSGNWSTNLVFATGFQGGDGSFTLTVDKELSGTYNLSFYRNNIPGISIREVKLEKGNKATDWTPAPEDVEGDAQAKADAAKNTAISTAATDATTKVNNAKNAAVNEASLDATNKVNELKRTVETELSAIPGQITLATKEAVDSIQIGGDNLLRNGDFSRYAIDNSLAWDQSLNGVYRMDEWGTGYNSGVPSPTVGYHAHLNIDKFGYPVLELVNKNSQFGLANRWMGVSAGVYQSKKLIPGGTYTFSADLMIDTIGMQINGGLYTRQKGATVNAFSSGFYSISSSLLNEWVRVTFTFVVDKEVDLTYGASFFIYGHHGKEGIAWVRNVALQQGTKGFYSQSDGDTEADITKLNTRVSEAELKITPDAIRSTVKSQTETIAATAKSEAITAAATDATAKANSAKDAAINDAATKYTTKTELSTSITQLSDSIALKASQSDLSALASRMSSAELKITPDAINSTVKSQTEIIASEAAAAVQVGGRNYVLKSKDERSDLRSVSGGGGHLQYFTPLTANSLEFGDLFYLSFDAKGTFAGRLNSYGANADTHYNSHTINITTDWKRYYIQKTITNRGSQNLQCEFWGVDVNLGIYIRSVKLEKGNKATDWTPAPEDVASDAQSKADEAKSAAIGTAAQDATAKAEAAKNAAISDAAAKYPTKTEFSSSITQLSDSIALKASQSDVSALNTRVASAEAKITTDAINLTVSTQIQTKIAESTADILNKNGTQLMAQNWALGSGSQFFYNQSGTTVENERVYGLNHLKQQVVLWECRPDGGNNADGGWSTNAITIDKSKAYRFSVFVKKTDVNGAFYFGAGTNTVCDLNTTNANNNPYFNIIRAFPEYNRWYLVVGYVYPYGTTGNVNNGEVWDCETGELANTGTTMLCFNWANVNWSIMRCFHFYNQTSTTRQWMWQPRIDLADGNEPSVASLIGFNFEKVKAGISITAGGIVIGGKTISLSGAVTFSSLASDAQGKITTAQSTADTAKSNAATAQTAANNAASAAGMAQTTANNAGSAAGAAQSTANSAKSAAEAAQGDLNALRGSLKAMAFEDKVELAKLGETVIQGGYIKTSLIKANEIVVNNIEAATGTFNRIEGISGNNNMLLTPSLLRFQNNYSSVFVGAETAPPSSGGTLSLPLAVRVNRDTTSTIAGNAGIYLSVQGSKAYDDNGLQVTGNHAVFIDKGDICGFRLRTRRVSSSQILNVMDSIVYVISANVTLTLPASPEDGQMYFIKNIGSGSFTLRSNTGQYLNFSRNASATTESSGDGNIHIVMYDLANKTWQGGWMNSR